MKAVHLLVNSLLPEDVRGQYSFDKKSMSDLTAALAGSHPEKYNRIIQEVADIGRHAAYRQGETLTLADMKPVIDKQAYLDQMDAELAEANNIKDPQERQEKRFEIQGRYAEKIEKDTMTAALAQGNNLGNTVVSGARGKPAQLKAMVTTPGLYSDYKDKPIDLFVRHSFGQGLRPAEYLASTFGARKGVISTKTATAQAGDLGKQMMQVASPITVTEDDCGTKAGIALSVDDPSLRGRVLSRSNTTLDRDAVQLLRKRGKEEVIARSPMTCQAKHGVCSKCLGADPRGKFKPIGYAAGATSAQSIAEPLAQCLAAGTLVRMADGTSKKIEDIQPGEFVLGSDKQGVITPTKVVNNFDNGLRECNEYNFKRKYVRADKALSVVSTPNHRMLLAEHEVDRTLTYTQQEINYVESKREVRAAVGRVFDDKHESFYYVPEARLIGVLLGDGCMSGGVSSGGLSLSAYDPAMVKDIEQDLANLGMLLSPQSTPGEYRVSMKRGSSADKQQMSNREYTRNVLKRVLTNEGLWGLKSNNKVLPKTIQHWDNDSVFNLIAGYLATDGCVETLKDKKVHFASNSASMLTQLKHLLEVRVGCVCNDITNTQKKKSNGVDLYAPTYRIYVTGSKNLRKLYAAIGDYIPGVKRDRFKQVITKTTQKAALLEPVFVEAKPRGKLRVYDLEVDHPDHLYLLDNGLITHNSGLDTKHSGGITKGKKKEFSGFDVLSQFTQVPSTFADQAAIANLDGRVEEIKDAPQGGQYIVVGGEEHYVLPGFDLNVKVGDEVEAGDILSDGLANPAEITKHKGIGEGRKYYSDRLKKILDDSGLSTDKKHAEVITRAAVNHIEVGDEDESGFLPGDIVQYSTYANKFNPAKKAKMLPVDEAYNGYLQEPVMHYSIGTRMTKKVADDLKKHGYNQAYVADNKPNFKEKMVRLRTASHHTPSWLQRQSTSYLKGNLQEDAAKGMVSDLKNSPYVADTLAKGTDFAENIEDTGLF